MPIADLVLGSIVGLPLLALVVFVVFTFVRGARQARQDADAPLQRANARVIDTRQASVRPTAKHSFATFELADGTRFELETTGADELTANDTGRLEWQGSRFVRFVRR